MKIRTGFVTNSSSYSSAEIRIDNPVLLEILKFYKKCNAFGNSFVSDCIGKKAKGKEMAWKLSNSELAGILFAPENIHDVLRCIIDVMDEGIRNADGYDEIKYDELKGMLEKSKGEIDAGFIDVLWHTKNESYGECAPEDGEEIEWEYKYAKSIGNELRNIFYRGGIEAKEARESRLKVEEEQAYFIRQSEQATKWLGDYESYLDDVKVINFKNKTFVFTGLKLSINVEEMYHSVVSRIVEMGGFCRKNVSGKTDYLIVYPGGAGDTKINDALEQRKNGGVVKIVLWDNLVNFLDNKAQVTASIQNNAEDGIDTNQQNNLNSIEDTAVIKSERTASNTATPIVNNEDDRQSSDAFDSAIDIEDYEYFFTDNRDVWIKKYKGIKKKVAIPALIENLPVTTIGSYAFDSNTEITDVELPSSITTIGNGSFHHCVNLSVINFPDKLETIERSAFSGCTSLTFVVLPSSLKVLQGEVFTGCSKLKSITLPSKLDTVFKNNFPSIKALVLIVPPNSPMEKWVKEKGFQYTYAGQGNVNSTQTDGYIEKRDQEYKEIEQRIAELKIEVHEFAEKVRADTERMNKRIADIERLQAEISKLTNEYNGITGWFKGQQRRELFERIEIKKAELNRLEEERFS